MVPGLPVFTRSECQRLLRPASCKGEVAPLDGRYPALSWTFVGVTGVCGRRRPSFTSVGEIMSALARDDQAPKSDTAVAWWRRHQIIVVGTYCSRRCSDG